MPIDTWNKWVDPELMGWGTSHPSIKRQACAPSPSYKPGESCYPHTLFCHPRLGYCGLVIFRPFYGFCEPGTCQPGYVFCYPFTIR